MSKLTFVLAGVLQPTSSKAIAQRLTGTGEKGDLSFEEAGVWRPGESPHRRLVLRRRQKAGFIKRGSGQKKVVGGSALPPKGGVLIRGKGKPEKKVFHRQATKTDR